MLAYNRFEVMATFWWRMFLPYSGPFRESLLLDYPLYANNKLLSSTFMPYVPIHATSYPRNLEFSTFV